jgi:molecular chaperone DnaK (HSP70)
MLSSKNSTYQVVVGVSLKTQYASYAYAFACEDYKPIAGRSKWEGQLLPYSGNLLAILYTPSLEVEAWGWEAKRKLAERRLKGSAKDYIYESNFMMRLFEAGQTSTASGLSADRLIVDYLRKLKELILQDLKSETANLIEDKEILWCLTVPAMWDETVKQLMRKAAQAAGMVGSSKEEAERLVLVSEPEAAAIYCMELEKHSLQTGDRLMIVDCGGGTVDITTHEFSKGAGLREIATGGGGPFGSTYIDEFFIQEFLPSKLSPEALKEFHDQEPLEFLEMMSDWERIKCSYTPSTKITCFRINPKFYKLLVRKYPDALKKLEESQYGEDTNILIDSELMEQIFEPVLSGLTRKIEEQFEKLGGYGCDYIYLVGGFSISPLLRKRVEEQFGWRVQKIVMPVEPGSAIVEGAVLFGVYEWHKLRSSTVSHSSNKYKVVVGVDFGTSRSGYAYAFKDDKNLVTRTKWEGSPLPYVKTLTHILYTPSLEVEAWGWEAKIKLAERRSNGLAKEYIYESNFKMRLFEDGQRNNTSGLSANRLITDYLRKLKELILQDLKDETANNVKDEEIFWCLTVPAIWDEANKQVMRKAAQEAGMIGSSESEANRLMLALEPEAAAIYCMEREKHSLQTGDRLMIVDCGGGTVDITTHEFSKGAGLREIATGGGGPFGSTYIDEFFIQEFLPSKLSPEALKEFHDQEPLEFLEMMSDWERIKCSYTPSTKITYFRINPKFYKLLVRKYPDALKKLEESQYGEDTNILIDSELMEQIFESVLSGLTRTIEEQFEKLDGYGCDYIFLVGGFSTSPLLRKRVEEQFGWRVKKIVMPVEPGAAIVEGAVSFGLDPTTIRARCSRLTYGYRCSKPFEEGIDPERKRFFSERAGQDYCDDRFGIMAAKGESIEADKITIAYINPNRKYTPSTRFKLLSTNQKRVRYTDESDVIEHEELEFFREGDACYSDKGWEIKFHFGETEIRAEITDQATNETKKAKLRFSHTY